MIRPRSHSTVIVCDGCASTTKETKGSSPWARIAIKKEAKAEGWLVRRGLAIHVCPSCARMLKAKAVSLYDT